MNTPDTKDPSEMQQFEALLERRDAAMRRFDNAFPHEFTQKADERCVSEQVLMSFVASLAKDKARGSVSANMVLSIRDEDKPIVDKFRVETIRHAANAIFNKVNEAMTCQNGFQSHLAMRDIQSLADIIVQSENSDARIGMKAFAATTGGAQT